MEGHMRADAVIAALATSQRLNLAKELQVVGDDVASLSAAMRSDALASIVHAKLRTRALQDDLALLCANPFDPVAETDVSDIVALCRLGLLSPTSPGLWSVNLDMALTLVPTTSLEFGFAPTLLARLSAEDFKSTARALQVSPQKTRVDYILALADEMCRASTLTRVIMQLREEEREPLREALAAGELPDAPEGWTAKSPPPTVQVHASDVGRRGLVLQIAQPSVGVEMRAIVPLESMDLLPDILAQTPAPPPVITKTVRRRTTTAAPKAERSAPARPPVFSLSEPVDAAPDSRQVVCVMSDASVRLPSEEAMRLIRENRELVRDVISIFDRTRVLLRPGVDSARWSNAAAVFLADHRKRNAH